MEQTRTFLLSYLQNHPDSEITDCFKVLYQSTFGCGHLIADPCAAADYIRREAAEASNTSDHTLEALDGDYTRVPLTLLQNGLSADTLAKLFTLSAQKPHGDIPQLTEKLAVLLQLAREQLIPFSADAVQSAAAAWGASGYPAVHHSARYRETYRPAYRLIHNDYIPWLPLFAEIDRRYAAAGQVLAAIEGGSASGKSTLGSLLSEVYDCNIFHMDDYFLQAHQRTKARLAEVGGNVDYERFEQEVLLPLSQRQTVLSRVFDCSDFSIRDGVKVPYKPLTFVEGAYSMHPKLAGYYDCSVYLKIDQDLQRKRIHVRNTPFLQEKFFSIWIPMENRYFAQTDIESRCSLILEVNG